jgi:hypothetical protein
MDDAYYNALRRTGEAWEEYLDGAERDFGEGAESERCALLWSRFQEAFIKLKTLRESHRRG